MERLTERHLGFIETEALEGQPNDKHKIANAVLRSLVNEIRARRAADLSKSDLGALEWARKYLDARTPVLLPSDLHHGAVEALDSLLAAHRSDT